MSALLYRVHVVADCLDDPGMQEKTQWMISALYDTDALQIIHNQYAGCNFRILNFERLGCAYPAFSKKEVKKEVNRKHETRTNQLRNVSWSGKQIFAVGFRCRLVGVSEANILRKVSDFFLRLSQVKDTSNMGVIDPVLLCETLGPVDSTVRDGIPESLDATYEDAPRPYLGGAPGLGKR